MKPYVLFFNAAETRDSTPDLIGGVDANGEWLTEDARGRWIVGVLEANEWWRASSIDAAVRVVSTHGSFLDAVAAFQDFVLKDAEPT